MYTVNTFRVFQYFSVDDDGSMISESLIDGANRGNWEGIKGQILQLWRRLMYGNLWNIAPYKQIANFTYVTINILFNSEV